MTRAAVDDVDEYIVRAPASAQAAPRALRESIGAAVPLAAIQRTVQRRARQLEADAPTLAPAAAKLTGSTT